MEKWVKSVTKHPDELIDVEELAIQLKTLKFKESKKFFENLELNGSKFRSENPLIYENVRIK